jgi:hypothetical protein
MSGAIAAVGRCWTCPVPLPVRATLMLSYRAEHATDQDVGLAILGCRGQGFRLPTDQELTNVFSITSPSRSAPRAPAAGVVRWARDAGSRGVTSTIFAGDAGVI